MAAGSDLLDDVFNTEVDEKVVSDLVGSLESELTGAGQTDAAAGSGSTESRTGSPATAAANPNVQSGSVSQDLAKTAVQGGVITGGPPMDGAAGATTTTTTTTTMTAGPSPPKNSAASAVATVTTDPAIGATPAAAAAVKTLNGSTSGTGSHTPGVTKANPPLSTATTAAAAAAVTPTSLPAAHAVVAPAPAAPQSALGGVPTVTLVRPPVQTSPVASTATVAGVTGPGPTVIALESPKTIVQATAPMVSAVSTVSALAAKSPAVLQSVRTAVPSAIAAAAPGPPAVRTIAAQVLAPRLPQPQPSAPNVQNIQLPPGMVLVRSESGQLLMIHHQTLAQMQAQSQSQSAMTPRPATPTSTPSVQLTSLQAPGGSLLARRVTPNTLIKPGSTVQPTTTLQRPPILQNTIMLGGSATTPGQPLGTATTGQPVSTAPAITQRIGPTGTPVGPTPISAETLENVKKCRNFLSTLIKLASSGKQSPETTANVKELVKNLLEGKIEPEDFTSRLYKELNSSPQPYLVPFLKRSLPALRQMTSDSTAFIHQSQLPLPCPQPSVTSTALTAMVLRPPLSTTAATTTTTTRTPVVTLTQTPHSKPVPTVPQQQGATVRPQATLAQPSMVTLRGQPHPRVIMSQPQAVKQLQTGSVPVVKQTMASGNRGALVAQSAQTAAQRNKLKEAGGGTFRDDDDINDVASMAGVDLSEESARILATNSDVVGTVTRSCKDQPFLSTTLLTRRVLEIGRKFGVGDLGQEVINYISHATQQRLQNLLEKVSEVAQQRNLTFKEDERFEPVTDVRTQLKFFEQLDQMEKQRKEEQEREILMKAAKSRSRQEDPEQLRLKQKAKEMQQQELAQIRQREANLTALAAIGPRKKRKMGSPASGAVAEGSGSGAAQPGGSNGGGSRQFTRQRITRVNLRDLLFCLENERETGHSHLLYKGLLK
ncbi:unnamed protein product [Merluccius merluccius]